MKLIALLIVAVLMSGCASNGGWWRWGKKNDYAPPPPVEKKTMRQSIGRPIWNAGQSLGRAGTIVGMTAGISPLTFPLIIPALVVWAVALPMYYGGIVLSGDKPDTGPFDP